ncbi:MarR family winged helix-turn-helix transcriptional regulator [Bosea vestrisii]|jgi:DNA-binding MarR family transcriptional regulator|uniref:MarR family winged helix-turn-helix transcriptional regulator n=1 Tax=Bosea vestrisii TaxID=151416 RepID=A0ABW0H5F4_9HYPH
MTRDATRPSPEEAAEAAAEAWRLMFGFLMRSAPERLLAQQERGLTPNDARALSSLLAGDKPMGALAKEWACDPSTATWLVDRLERAGLAERVASAADRRVKLVRATEKGRATMQELTAAYHRPPAELTRLAQGDLTELARILRMLQPDEA